MKLVLQKVKSQNLHHLDQLLYVTNQEYVLDCAMAFASFISSKDVETLSQSHLILRQLFC